MDSALDRSLDEILADRQQTKRNPRGNNNGGSSNNNNNNNNNRRDGGRRRERQDYPRDGVRKSFRDDAPRNLDSEWVHDRFEDNGGRRSAPRRRHSPDGGDTTGTKIRVDNIHYDLTQEDLEGLFSKIGPLVKLDLQYDRAGRSEGTAYVTYGQSRDANTAIQEFDGANANGQPIRLTLMPSGPSSRRNPFDNAVMPGRPLAERITIPGGRSRSLSPRRNRELDDEEAARRGVDRYRPGGKSRSPMPRGRREGGRRPGARRDGGRDGGREGGAKAGGEKGGRSGREGRPKKTQEELDAEMADYFGGGEAQNGSANAESGGGGAAAASAAPEDDIDMIE